MAEEPGPQAGQGEQQPIDTSYGAAKLNTGWPCPVCGVKVAPGYPKCPKCHAVLPQRSAPHAPSAPVSGGTSLSEDRNLAPWIGGAVAVAVVIAVAVFATGGGSAPEQAAAQEDEADGGEAAVDDTRPAPVDDDDFFADVDDPEADAVEARRRAVAELGRALNKERMWSQVSVDGVMAVVETDFCDDETLMGITEDFSEQLKAAGFGAIQCYSKFGVLAFERKY